MFDYNSIVDDNTLVTTFVPDKEIPNRLNAFISGSDEPAGYVDINGATFEASNDQVFMQYKLWQTRPERAVGKKVEIQGKNLEELIEAYEELFIGCFLMTQTVKVAPDSPKPYVRALDWLRTTDFYKAPASTKYHEAFPGGLLIHSLNVYNKLLELISIDTFSAVSLPHAAMTALVHDWCKIGYYESYQKNVKNDQTGQWEKVTAYTVNQKGIPLGHGVTSMYLAMQVMRLTVEQALAIRWHMSVWSVAETEKSELQEANKKYPMVYLLQFADQLSCTEYLL